MRDCLKALLSHMACAGWEWRQKWKISKILHILYLSVSLPLSAVVMFGDWVEVDVNGANSATVLESLTESSDSGNVW